MLRTRNLNDPDLYIIKTGSITIKRTSNYKVVSIIYTDDLSWNQHINHTLSSFYASLQLLSRIKKLTPYHVRKQLAEALIRIGIDYGNAIFCNAPDYLKNRMEKVINATAG